MRSSSRLACLLSVCAVLAVLTGSTTRACRFNVRDVGFADLDPQSYRLFCFVDQTVTPAQREQIRSIALAALLDTNIESELVDLADPSGLPESAKRSGLPDGPLPAAVLEAPDGRAMSLPLVSPNTPLSDSLWENFEAVCDSPKRSEIVRCILETYGAVLLIEGSDAAANERARQAAQSAIARVARAVELKQLEKEIERPPRLLVLSLQERDRESVLLWSLNAQTQETAHPQIAILYGRGRQIGRVLKGQEITERSVSDILNTVGLSCECGLDRSWMQGARIPMRWDQTRQTLAAQNLGFDPESPMIKTEMAMILSKGPGTGRGRTGTARSADGSIPGDDREVALEPMPDDAADAPRYDPGIAQIGPPAPTQTRPTDLRSRTTGQDQTQDLLDAVPVRSGPAISIRLVAVIVGAMAALVLAISVVLWWRS